MKHSILLAIFFSANFLIHAQTSTPPSAGNGSMGDPYQIKTIENLYWLSQTHSVWEACFIQTANIDASSTNIYDNGKGFTPIGNASTHFTGHYDGQYYTIDQLYINRPSTTFIGQDGVNIGLFGLIDTSAVLQKICLTKVTVKGNNYYTGGIVGYNNGSISNSYSTGSVTGGRYTGGLTGFNFSTGTISKCYSYCTVSGGESVGGLTGINMGNINNSYATGSVEGTGGYLGGLVGYNYGGTINNSYSTGSVVNTYYPINNTVGGFVGWNAGGSVKACFWDMNTSGNSTSGGGYGRSRAEMKTQSTFINAGWDFTGIWEIIGAEYYANYPTLISNPITTFLRGNEIPKEYTLFQNYPNPFKKMSKINWQVPFSCWQSLKIYDLQGTEIATLVDEFRPAGQYHYDFNGEKLISGIYFYKLNCGNLSQVKKMIKI